MALLDDVGARLEAAGVAGAGTGWALAKSYLPPSPDRIIVVLEAPGGEVAFDPEDPHFDWHAFQVQGRAGEFEYELLRGKMQSVFNALHDRVLGGGKGHVFGTAGSPTVLGHDENQRPRLAWNFAAYRLRDLD